MSNDKGMEFSYRMVALCAIGVVVLVMGITLMQSSDLRRELRLVNTKNETLTMENKKLKNYIEQIQDWRALLKKKNPQEIKHRLDRDKLLRPKNIMFEID